MSAYNTSFEFLGRSSKDFNLIRGFFDSDNGESSSFLAQEQISSNKYDGSKKNLYGVRNNETINFKISMIKSDHTQFTTNEARDIFKWLTGNKNASWLKLFMEDVLSCKILCTLQDIKTYKLDGRTIGFVFYFESLYPWAYSDVKIVERSVNGKLNITIENNSDELYRTIPTNVTFVNNTGDSVIIENKDLNLITKVLGLASNEKIIISDNQFIKSDKPNKIFGDNFNFVFQELKSGQNSYEISGNGTIKFEYLEIIKIGNFVQEFNSETIEC